MLVCVCVRLTHGHTASDFKIVSVFQKCKILLRFGARRDFPANQAEARHKGGARIPFPNRKNPIASNHIRA